MTYTGTRITASVDGTMRADTPSAGNTGGPLTLLFGIPYIHGPATPWEVRLDNVVVYAN